MLRRWKPFSWWFNLAWFPHSASELWCTASALCTQVSINILINGWTLTCRRVCLGLRKKKSPALCFSIKHFQLGSSCIPVCALPLVEGCSASRAVLLLPVLTAQPGGAGHVVVGHRGRLHRLQGLEGGVASGGQQEVDFVIAVLQRKLF